MTKGKGSNPGAGSLGKHVKRAAYRERGQPEARKALGHLEKHKDYVRRAKRRHERQGQLKTLKRAAALRNPDEFNVKMTQYVLDGASGKMKKRDRRTRTEKLTAQRDLNARNVGYLQRRAHDDLATARDALVASGDAATGLEAPIAAKNQHIVFVDDDADVAEFNAVRHFKTTKAMLAAPALRGNVERMGTLPVAHALEQSGVDDAQLLARFYKGELDAFDTRFEKIRADLEATMAEGIKRQRERDEIEGNDGALELKIQRAAAAASPLHFMTGNAPSLRAALAAVDEHRRLVGIAAHRQNEMAAQAAGLTTALPHSGRRSKVAQYLEAQEAGKKAPISAASSSGMSAKPTTAELPPGVVAQQRAVEAKLLHLLRAAAIREVQQQEAASRVEGVRRCKQVTERVLRAQRLGKLAKRVEKRTTALTNQLNEKQRAKFKGGATVRKS